MCGGMRETFSERDEVAAKELEVKQAGREKGIRVQNIAARAPLFRHMA